ncbi:hypothetical protein TNCV_1626541 [Trichonephila clavipes]|nr:hypothetical protein TNCV_1626541 [Trichonephila clavipes]
MARQVNVLRSLSDGFPPLQRHESPPKIPSMRSSSIQGGFLPIFKENLHPIIDIWHRIRKIPIQHGRSDN